MIKKSIGFVSFHFFRIEYKFIRFLIIGVINTLFSLSIYWILVYFGVHYTLAMFTGNMLGTLFNYVTTGRLVFENKSKKLIFKFFAVNFLIYLLSIASLKGLFLVGFSKYISAVIIAPPMAVIAFFLFKYIVFKKAENED
jgi:putative flippase GtrA